MPSLGIQLYNPSLCTMLEPDNHGRPYTAELLVGMQLEIKHSPKATGTNDGISSTLACISDEGQLEDRAA